MRKKHARNAAARNGRIVVRPRPGRRDQGLLRFGGLTFACAIGRGGIRALKREGDGATPLAAMQLVSGYFRADRRVPARSALPMRAIRPRDGWCDVPGDRNYNRPVRLPYPAGAERMMRADRLYDLCIVLDHNLRQRRRGMGSAIFFHLAGPGLAPTEGCVAVPRHAMMRLLPLLSKRVVLDVRR